MSFLQNAHQVKGRNATGIPFGGFDYTARVEMLVFGKFQFMENYVGSAKIRENNPKSYI